MRNGVVANLQNRVAPAKQLEALALAESMVTIFGDRWLIGEVDDLHGHDVKTEPTPADRCLLLILEHSRVEAAVLMNDLANLKDEACKNSNSSPTGETFYSKKRNVALVFSLLEKIISLISNAASEDEEEARAC
ncbi:hypothetical protein M0R45_031811 [Rubus argutus]|uniref:Uncharacterized protein n=1 Tax=Rubus argutus TaxID=59490 RepID=A0AAW1WHJ8_RUBAR